MHTTVLGPGECVPVAVLATFSYTQDIPKRMFQAFSPNDRRERRACSAKHSSHCGIALPHDAKSPSSEVATTVHGLSSIIFQQKLGTMIVTWIYETVRGCRPSDFPRFFNVASQRDWGLKKSFNDMHYQNVGLTATWWMWHHATKSKWRKYPVHAPNKSGSSEKLACFPLLSKHHCLHSCAWARKCPVVGSVDCSPNNSEASSQQNPVLKCVKQLLDKDSACLGRFHTKRRFQSSPFWGLGLPWSCRVHLTLKGPSMSKRLTQLVHLQSISESRKLSVCFFRLEDELGKWVPPAERYRIQSCQSYQSYQLTQKTVGIWNLWIGTCEVWTSMNHSFGQIKRNSIVQQMTTTPSVSLVYLDSKLNSNEWILFENIWDILGVSRGNKTKD